MLHSVINEGQTLTGNLCGWQDWIIKLIRILYVLFLVSLTEKKEKKKRGIISTTCILRQDNCRLNREPEQCQSLENTFPRFHYYSYTKTSNS